MEYNSQTKSIEKKPLLREIVEYRYESKTVRKAQRIFKKTKNKRIKDKCFKKMLSCAINERKVILGEEAVLIDYGVYKELIETVMKYNGEIEKIKNDIDEKILLD